ncbi:MAG: hypothetical protein QOD76_1921, partial [Solirubrobacteraceae bacterium]|nr:hypothetical protein [Solirubrobacteraceae bacterium]
MRRRRGGIGGLVTLAAAAMLAAATAPPAPAATDPTCLTPVAPDGHEPICNPYLASSAWSTPHRASYAQDSVPFAGPEPGDGVRYEHRSYPDIPVIVQVSEPYPDGKRVLWFSTTSAPDAQRVYKADYDTLAPIASWDVTREGGSPAGIPNTSGVYNVLVRGDHFVTLRARSIQVYGDAQPRVRTSDIKLLKRLTVPDSAFCRSDDRIIGLTVLFTGELAFATVNGVIGVVPLDLGRMDAAHLVTHSLNGARCADPNAAIERISNSLAADEDGGIYPVTDHAQYRIDFAGGRLAQAWRAEYETGGGSGGARLDAGSGSTPTVMGTDPRDDKFVVITDGAPVANLTLFWRGAIPPDWPGLPGRDRRIACVAPQNFGDPAAKSTISEQSVVVRGYASYVVNNALGLDAAYGLLPDALRPASAAIIPPGTEPHGMQRTDWDPRSRTCRSVWANRRVSIPNGVPSASAASGMVYGMGYRDGMWGLEGLDAATGADRLWVPATASPEDNSFFAQTTPMPDGSIITGTFLGLTAFRQPRPKPALPLACKDVQAPVAVVTVATARARHLLVRGTATDRGCGGVRRVEVAVAARRLGRCIYLQP